MWYFYFQGESINIDEELQAINGSTPCIVGFGDCVKSVTDFKVVIEGENIFPMPSLIYALHFCFAAYYVFNISFPVDFRFVLLFLEKFVYGLKPSQKLPLSISVLADSFNKTAEI